MVIGTLNVQRNTVRISLADSLNDVTVRVIQAHGGTSYHVSEHSLFCVSECIELGLVLFVGGIGLERPAVAVGAVLRKPLFHFVNGHADKDLLKLVHLLSPCTSSHAVAVAALPLGLPAGDLGGKGLFGVWCLFIDFAVVVNIPIVSALAGETAEVRHAGTIIVGGGHFQLVNVQRQDSALCIEQSISHNLVEAVNRRAGVI